MNVPENKSNSKENRDNKSTLIMIVLFYFSTCGAERLFQTLEFTFGLCGPLKLPAKKAVIIDDCYNGGFFIGRLLSVLAVNFMSPKFMLKVSLTLCTVATVSSN